MTQDEQVSQWLVIAVVVMTGAEFVLCGSMWAGFWLESRAAALIALAAFAIVLSIHLLLGVVEYRKTMRRPWPAVPPLEDDDDWP